MLKRFGAKKAEETAVKEEIKEDIQEEAIEEVVEEQEQDPAPEEAAPPPPPPPPPPPVQKKVQPPKEVSRKVLHVKYMPTRAAIKRVEFDVTVPHDTTIDDLLNPVFWSAVSGSTFSLNPHNKVDVHWEGGKQYAQLYVRQAGPNFAIMALLDHHVFSKASLDDVDSPYKISYTGPVTGYRVLRKADMQHMKDGFKSEEEAYEYARTLHKGIY